MNTRDKRSTSVTLRLTPGLLARLDALATRVARKRNDLINLLLALELDRIDRDRAELGKL